MTTAELLNDPVVQFNMALMGRKDCWVPASGGTETPFRSRSGRRLLYCYNPGTEQHAYVDCDTDIVLTNEEAGEALRLW
jgi:hypothetical protein